MRRTTSDKTLERNFIQKWQFLIKEYELVKQQRHPKFRFVSDFYKFHGTNRQTFNKYYNRFKRSNNPLDFFPRKRGPKWKSRRPLPLIENMVEQQRLKGLNRFEICEVLRPKLKRHTPSPSGVYNICKRKGLNRLKKKMVQSKRKIIKEKAGELGHVDCHYLSKDLIMGQNKRYYLVCVIDDCTRLAWAEVVDDVRSLTVMFATLRAFNFLGREYGIQFEEILSDNGSEFASKNNTDEHPYERMLKELGIKHRYTKPYRPQTNGKVERFWRTLNEDLIDGTNFESKEEFINELQQYLLYYNEHRPHQGINGKIPKNFNENLSTN